ncbi:hypothetical protein [Nocardia sp. BSTN01]|uniref:hypothetical protein n=1 Tax=Nocardia sp. BSTN01 TaxID=2783665 RepID=UPI0035CCCF84
MKRGFETQQVRTCVAGPGCRLVWLTFIRADGNFWIDVLPGSLPAAFGTSLAFVPSLQTAISAARPEQGGLASGLVKTGYQIGSPRPPEPTASVTPMPSPTGSPPPSVPRWGIAVLAAALAWATFRSTRRERVPADV